MDNEQKTSHKIGSIMNDIMHKIKTMIDVNTVIGEPVTLDKDTLIIPVTKVIVGVVAGGAEYTENTLSKKRAEEYPFAVGSGSGFQIVPIGFLLKQGENYQMINASKADSIANLASMVSKIVNTFAEKKQEGEKDETKL